MVLTPHLHRKKPTGSCCFQDFLRVPQRPYKWVSLWQDVFLHEKHINLAWHTTALTDLRSETVPTSIHVALLQLLGSSFEKNAKKTVDLLPMPQKDGEDKIHYHSESYRQLPPNNCLAPKKPMCVHLPIKGPGLQRRALNRSRSSLPKSMAPIGSCPQMGRTLELLQSRSF